MIIASALLVLQMAAAQPAEPSRNVDVLVSRARAARLQQDSMLASYESVVRQRMSGGVGIALTRGITLPLSRDRLAARFESVARVGWSQAHGAWGEVIAARSVLPMFGNTTPVGDGEDVAVVLPYYPGRDRLWPTGELTNAVPNASQWILHPLSAQADSAYDYSIGDSLSIRLQNQTVIRVIEIRVRPRRASSNLVVGSLWVDQSSGSLVRAAYRPSIPVDLFPFIAREVGEEDRKKIRKFGPFTGTIREVLIEHGLYQGQFWLPRTRIVSAEGNAAAGRVSLSIEQTFQYENVVALPAGESPRFLPDTVSDIDPRTGRVRRPKWYDIEQRTGRCRLKGDSGSRWSADSLARDSSLTTVVSDGVRVRILLPCDREELVNSPALPASIYGPGEEMFSESDFARLRGETADALSIGKQAKASAQPIAWHYGIDRGMLRYNRIEGLSAGVLAERVLGNGYTGGALVRLGMADLEPLGELFINRSNGATAVQASAYRRLAPGNDWGNPLGLGASASALLFGRDDGFYYRTLGAEVTGVRSTLRNSFAVQWRLFGEQQRTALVETQHSLAHLIDGVRFTPNIVANEGWFWGGASTVSYGWGDDPRARRVGGNTRLEVATGTSSYVRAMTEFSVMRGLTKRSQLGITTSAGTSVGEMPVQRNWFLGGPYTVHGHRAGTVAGNAFWLARAELSAGKPMARPVLFADAGWAGNRRDIQRASPTITGAGVGLSMMGGLVRLDVARGFEPTKRWRADFYFEIR